MDDEFYRYLEKEYGKQAVKNFLDTAPSDALVFQRDYENQKRQLSLDSDVELKIRIPPRMTKAAMEVSHQDLQDSIKPFLNRPVGKLTFNTHTFDYTAFAVSGKVGIP